LSILRMFATELLPLSCVKILSDLVVDAYRKPGKA
jgi:hypothetical protein